jgi:hypothetical protein
MRARWLLIGSGNPDVAVAIPAVVAGMPGPVAVLGWWRRDTFMGTGRRSDADDDLSLGNACRKEHSAGSDWEEFLHRAISLWCCRWDAVFSRQVVVETTDFD